MQTPNEYTLVEKPIIEALQRGGYRYISRFRHPFLRSRENEVLFRPLLINALVRLNKIPKDAAEAIYNELAGLTDNERWLEILRGQYSKKIPGEDFHRTIKLVDYDNLDNNDFAVTNQLRVKGAVVCKPDLVVYLNGIPVVVIEAKSPINPGQNTWSAVSQMKQYETNAPRLFHPNLFNIATNDLTFLYAATGALTEFWFRWRDPWPRKSSEFMEETQKGLYALLDRARLLDILAHFIIFETRKGITTKKIARYQQYRAVNKMVQRVLDGEHNQGLVWHTQGSGKSLTMVFAALKLKFHRGITHDRLRNPNLLVVTDRKDLHDQITQTFDACGLPNPVDADSIRKLQSLIVPGVSGRTILSTIFKFRWSDPRLKDPSERKRKEALRDMAVAGSEDWIVMVDEAHRTQEKDLGAYLRAILPQSVRFGFTGTPVKKGDMDTYTNFGVRGEKYLDKYGIQDAVADGATVPVYYQGRLTEWHLHAKKVDVLFDQYFANESEEIVKQLKERGVTRGDLARFPQRIELIAEDIWTHFRLHVLPDGFKAQIVAIDRLSCVAYKEALDKVIAHYLIKAKKVDPAEAAAQAAAMSVCVYSPGQHDQEEHPELVKHQLDEKGEKDAIKYFNDPNHPLKFLIVCNKLLTGFDAPVEQAMYLDSPLTDHNLLQAIARTNRRCGSSKRHGLILDYIGVSTKLVEALAAYNSDDIEGALTDEDALHDDLRAAHREVMDLIKGVPRTGVVKKDVLAVVFHLATQGGEDAWYVFRAKATAFVKAYGALSPDPRVLPYQVDLKFVGAVIPYGELHFENKVQTNWKAYSEKIREILDLYLEVTGLKTVVKLRSLSDPAFWEDFDADAEDLHTAAIRKLAELKKEATERTAHNEERYGKFSDLVKALIKDFQSGLLDAAEVLEQGKTTAQRMLKEDRAFEKSGLNERAYDIFKILEKHQPEDAGVDSDPDGDGGEVEGGEDTQTLSPLKKAAAEIDELYASDLEAPPHWHIRPDVRKELRQRVRRILRGLSLEDRKAISRRIDEYAIANYAKP